MSIASPAPELATEIRTTARRCRQLSEDLVQAWNRITSIRTELAQPRTDPERRADLAARLETRMTEQDGLEAEMTTLAARWVTLTASAEAPRRPTAAMRERRQPSLFEAGAA